MKLSIHFVFRLAGASALLLSMLLVGCGGGDAGQSGSEDSNPTIELSAVTKGRNFGEPATPAEQAAAGKRMAQYFDGRHSTTDDGLIGASRAANGDAYVSKALAPLNAAARVHRFFNTLTGVHFYTISEEEKAYVQGNLKIFQYEGPTFLAFPRTESVLSPVYRFYNKISGTHFYTISETEKNHVIATWPDIFNFEGVGWYASKVRGDNWVPIYRFFNKITGVHFYTPNEVEKQNVIDKLPQFIFEGIGYYVKVPSAAPEPVQLQVDKAVLKADVIKDAQTFLTQIDKVNFHSSAGRSWTVGQVFLFNGGAYKISGFLTNTDGSVALSTVRVPISEAYSDLKFTFKAHALAYGDDLNPLPAAKLALQQKASSDARAVSGALNKAAVTGLQCLTPKQTASGMVTTNADLEWGYTFELNNCSLNELLNLGSSFPAGGINLNGTMKITSVVKHEYDLSQSTNLTTTSSSATMDIKVSGSLTQLARDQLMKRTDICKQENGVLVCEQSPAISIGKPITVWFGAVPVTVQTGIGFKFTVDINGAIVFRGTSGYEVVEGNLVGRPVKQRRQTASSFNTPELGLQGDAELEFFGYGLLEAGIGVEALDVEGYLAKISAKGGAYGKAAVKAALPVCANFSGGLRVSGEIEALRLGKYYLAKIEDEWDLELVSGSFPSACSAKGHVRLDYVMTGKGYYTQNYTAYGADIPVDVFDASMDFFNPLVDGGFKRIDLTAVPTKSGKQVSYEFEMLAGNTSTAKLVNFTQVGGDAPYTRVFIDPGNTTYGDVVKFKMIAYEADDRINTETTRRVEIRIEPALAAQPEYWTVINTNGDEQYFVRYNYAGNTAAAIRSGYLAMAGASSLHFNSPAVGEVQSFKELPLYNADQRVYMRPAQLALLGKHDRDGNEKLFSVVQRTDVVVDTIGISPVTPTVGQVVTLTISGERLPAALAVSVPNCTGLQELRSAGNVLHNNYATGVRVYECTASAPGTNLIARVGPNNKPFVFTIGPATACPSGQTLQNGVCVAVPTITGVTPLTAVLDAPTTFTVTGLNLPLTTQLVIGTFAECLTPTNRSSTGFQQTCTPRGTTGSKLLTIMTDSVANGGTVLDSSRSLSVTAALSTGFGLVSNYSKEECIQDYATGLIWEGKTTSGLRSGANRYSNYDNTASPQKWTGGGPGANPTQAEVDVTTNSIGYRNYVNSIALCGFRDWRVPTKEELITLLHPININPTVDGYWLPNTASYFYWTSSPDFYYGVERAWFVRFDNGVIGNSNSYRNYSFSLRLVRAGQ